MSSPDATVAQNRAAARRLPLPPSVAHHSYACCCVMPRAVWVALRGPPENFPRHLGSGFSTAIGAVEAVYPACHGDHRGPCRRPVVVVLREPHDVVTLLGVATQRGDGVSSQVHLCAPPRLSEVVVAHRGAESPRSSWCQRWFSPLDAANEVVTVDSPAAARPREGGEGTADEQAGGVDGVHPSLAPLTPEQVLAVVQQWWCESGRVALATVSDGEAAEPDRCIVVGRLPMFAAAVDR